MYDPTRISYKITLKTTSQTRMFDGSRTIALDNLREKLERLFSESNLDEFDLIWKDVEGDMIPIRMEQDFRVAMKHIGQGQVVKFILAPKGSENSGKKEVVEDIYADIVSGYSYLLKCFPYIYNIIKFSFFYLSKPAFTTS